MTLSLFVEISDTDHEIIESMCVLVYVYIQLDVHMNINRIIITNIHDSVIR